ncbi:magnesium and cobalt transport protein CorA [Tessaracoccus sp. Y36]
MKLPIGRALTVAAAALAVAVVQGAVLTQPGSVAVADGSGGSGISVWVLETTPSPSPSGSVSPTAKPSATQSASTRPTGRPTAPVPSQPGPPSVLPSAAPSSRPTMAPPSNRTTRPSRPVRPGSSNTPRNDRPESTDSASAVPTSPAASVPPEKEEVSIGGLLYVSGLAGDTRISINPWGGSHTIRFTVRNASNATLDAEASFRMLNLFGQQLGPEMAVEIKDLEPDEVREVAAEMTGLGQWTLVKAETVFTPPEKLGDTELAPVKRDQWVFFIPWYLLGGTGLAIAAVRLGPRLIRQLGGSALSPEVAG